MKRQAQHEIPQSLFADNDAKDFVIAMSVVEEYKELEEPEAPLLKKQKQPIETLQER